MVRLRASTPRIFGAVIATDPPRVSRLLSALLPLLLAWTAAAPLHAQKDVDYDGVAEIGAAWIYATTQTEGIRYFRGKIEFDIELSDEIDLQLDFRGDSRDEQVELRELHIDFAYTDAWRVRVGFLRKRFGLEDLSSRENLPVVERSDVNDFLSALGYVGRDYGVQLFRRYDDEGPPVSYLAGLAYNESHTASAHGHLILHDRADTRRLLAGLVFRRSKNIEVEAGVQHVAAANVGLELERGPLIVGVEAFGGNDPVESALRAFLGEDDRVFFLAGRGVAYRHVALPGRVVRAIEPVLLVGVLAPDAAELDANRLQAHGGLNIYFDDDVRLMIEGFGLAARNRFQSDRAYSGSTFRVVLQAQW